MLDAETRGIIAEGKPRELRDTSPNPKVRAFFRPNGGGVGVRESLQR